MASPQLDIVKVNDLRGHAVPPPKGNSSPHTQPVFFSHSPHKFSSDMNSKSNLLLLLLVLAALAGHALALKPAGAKINAGGLLKFRAPAGGFGEGATPAALVAAGAKVAVTSAPSLSTVLAKALGYVLGAGSLFVYAPIALNVLKTKNADGLSVATWCFNLLGLSVALVYPFKKAFPLSTYIEILILTVQSAAILGLVCSYQNLLKEYIVGMSLFSVVAASVALAPNINARVLQALQVAAILVCNWANVPQIMLTFRRKKAGWSWITAAMSLAGNLIRVFTTMQLTQDFLIMSGNLIGCVSNLTLLFQIWLYRKNV